MIINSSKQVLGKQNPIEVVIMKLLIIFIIAFIPVGLMMLDISRNFTFRGVVKQNKVENVNGNNEFNFETQAPVSGDISQVPREKIDSLFNNLKFK